MAKVVLEKVYIASIHPSKTDAVILPHGATMRKEEGRSTKYELKPVPREKMNKPFLLEVTDAYESVLDNTNTNGTFVARPVDVNQIADWLVNHWAGNMTDCPSPGIMKIIGTVPQQAELEELARRQTAYSEHMFERAEMLVFERRSKFITQQMRDAAIWLRRERNWVNQSISEQTEKCPACRQDMPIDAYICHHCGTKVRKFPENIEVLNATAPVVPTIPVPPTTKHQTAA